MKKAIVICCNKNDEVLLHGLEQNLQSVYPEAQLYVAPCSISPPETTLPKTTPLRWNTSFIAQDILKAMYLTDCDIVAKIDADTWHLKPYLFSSSQPISGIQWAHNPFYILGIGYTLTRKVITELMVTEPCMSCDRTQEDKEIMYMSRKKFPNGIEMLPIGTARKASTYDGQEDACVIHLGCDKGIESRIQYQRLFSLQHSERQLK
jgi:hypothetical protein